MPEQVKAVKKIAEIIQRLSNASILASKAKYEAETGYYQEALELLYWTEKEMDEAGTELSFARLYMK